MNIIRKEPIDSLGKNFISAEFIPPGKNEYYLRQIQNPDNGRFRHLTAHEIEVLVRNRNTSTDWNQLWVSDAFSPELVKNCKFFGMVRFGKLEPLYLEFNDLRMPVGLSDSIVINCDFGDNVVIDNVHYIAQYIIGNEVIITNVNELTTTNHAKFGNGILKEGETEDVRIWLEICNENGGRSVVPFDGMVAGDAWLWSRDRDNALLQRRYREMTERKFDNQRGYYGTIGDRTVIKNCSIIKDVKLGSDAYLKGANKMKNLTINSSPDAPTQIGEGCELVNGIIGLGCRIFYGVKAVRFVLGANSQLKYGARLINSYLGDNATISCCEVLNSLIFPAHEQHHNNSFLIAATIEGQSNIAAGATIGSNHNSRGADGELLAARGFWPALCSSLKHNSKFAPFTLLTKADYPSELNITLPFSLVSNDTANNELLIMPAYWLMYNLYALERNAWKYEARDKRTEKIQHFDNHYLAPDTVNSMFDALDWIENLATAQITDNQSNENFREEEGEKSGKSTSVSKISGLVAPAHTFENSGRKVRILKPMEACDAYRLFIKYYALESLFRYVKLHPETRLADLTELLSRKQERQKFVNVGGQLMPASELDRLKERICEYEITAWQQVHDFYKEQGNHYEQFRLNHAIASLQAQGLPNEISPEILKNLFGEYISIRKKIVDDVRSSRKKDYDSPFRQMVYSGMKELEAVVGRLDKTPFLLLQAENLKTDTDFINMYLANA